MAGLSIYKHNENDLSPITGHPHITPAGMPPVTINPNSSVAMGAAWGICWFDYGFTSWFSWSCPL